MARLAGGARMGEGVGEKEGAAGGREEEEGEVTAPTLRVGVMEGSGVVDAVWEDGKGDGVRLVGGDALADGTAAARGATDTSATALPDPLPPPCSNLSTGPARYGSTMSHNS